LNPANLEETMKTAAVLLASLILPWGATASAVQTDLPIRIRLYGVSAASEAMVDAARGRAEAVLRKIGILPLWLDCSGRVPRPECDQPPDQDEFVLRVVRTLGRRSTACGASVRGLGTQRGQLITIFADCVRRGAHRVRTPEAVILAYTLVHEIGHLLLPHGHSHDGIMRAGADRFDWLRASQGTLGFLPQQASQMRAALRAEALLAKSQ
jgi:hypothetical protein